MNRILLVFFSALFVAAGGFAGFNAQKFMASPFGQRVPFYFPFLTAVDQTGSSYVIDTGMRRIVALKNDGSLRWIKEGGKRTQDFYYAHGLATDSKDRLYVYNWVPKTGAEFKAESIQIQRYGSNGLLESKLWTLPNEQDTEEFPSYFSFFVQKDKIYTLYCDGVSITLTALDLEGKNPEVLRTLPKVRDFVALAGTAEGRLVGAARDGSLWEAEPTSAWHEINLEGIRKPWDLKFMDDGRLLVLDLLDGSIFRREENSSMTRILSGSKTGSIFADSMTLAPNGSLAIADKENQRLLVSNSPDQYTAYEGALISESEKQGRWLFWIALGIAGLSLLVVLFLVYRYVLRGWIPLLVSQLFLLVPVIILAQVIAVERVNSSLSERYRDQVQKTLMNAANLVAKLIPSEAVEKLNQPSDFTSEAYERLKVAAKSLQIAGKESNAYNYLAIYRNIRSLPYYVYTNSGTFGVDYPYTLLPDGAKALFTTSGKYFTNYSDDYGMYNAAFASLDDARGKPLGVIEIGRYADLQLELEKLSLTSAFNTALVMGGFIVFLFVMATLVLLRSVNSLRRMTREIAKGNLELSETLKNKDETGQLSRDFETMSSRLRGYMQNINALTEASARFVPSDLIALLGVDDLTELKLGHQTKREMTVMFSSVQNFRKLTGQMSAQGLFKFLNSYLAGAVPLIRENKGSIDKYMGESYMALFPGEPRNALAAWRAISRKLEGYNERRSRGGSEALQFTFGIHHGPLMLGIVGEKERMEGTVIADSVNLTSRLNGIGRIYEVSCVVTFSTLALIAGDDMADWKQRNPFRKLDYVMVKGKKEPLLICQPLDPEQSSVKPLLAQLPSYETAFGLWEAGNVEDALLAFEAVAAVLPHDPVVRRHADRCRKLLAEGLPEPWSPAVKITEK